MKATEAIEKWRLNPEWAMTPEDVKEMGKEEFRRFINLCFDSPDYREAMIEWFMKMYEPYFKEVLNESET